MSEAREEFRATLARECHERHYAPEYLARRCRTSPSRVIAWIDGTAVPDGVEWDNLVRVSREFANHTALWRAACSSAPALETSAIADGVEVTTGKVADPVVPEPVTEVSVAEMPSMATSESRAIRLPGDFVVFSCKITGGRVIQIGLPAALTRADVARLHAFLLTQVDDFEAVERPRVREISIA